MAGPAILSIKILGDAKDARKTFADTEKAAGAFGGKMGKIGSIAKAGFMTMAVAAPTAALAMGKALYDIGAELDDMADTIRVGTGATGAALDGLINDAEKVAARVPASFDAVGKTIADVNTRLGLSGDTLQTVSSQYLEASRILGEEVDINSTSAAFNAWDVAGEKTSASLDTLFRTSQSTGAGMNKLADSLGKNASTLKLLDFSYEQSAGFIGLLDKAGLDADSTIGAMGKSLTTLAKQGEKPSDAFKRLTGSIKEMKDAGNLAGALDLSSKLFGTKQAGKFLDAIDKNIFSIDAMEKAAAGTGDTILGVGAQTQDAAEKFQLLQNRIKLALAPYAETVFSAAADGLNYLLDLWDNFDSSTLLGFFQHPSILAFRDKMIEIGGQLRGLWNAAQPFIDRLVTNFIPVLISLQNTFFAVFEPIKSALWNLIEIGQIIIDFWTNVFNGEWGKAWESLGALVSKGWELVTNLLSAGWEFIKGIFRTGGETIRAIWNTIWETVGNALSNAWESFKTTASNGITSLVDYVKGLPGRALGALGDVSTYLYQAGKDFINGFINGIGSMANALWDKVTGMASGAYDTLKGWLGIKSPSRKAMGLGMWFGRGFADGIAGQKDAVNAAAKDLFDLPSSVPVPEIPEPSSGGRFRRGEGQTVINITINGALDRRATAREIREMLEDLERSKGVVVV